MLQFDKISWHALPLFRLFWGGVGGAVNAFTIQKTKTLYEVGNGYFHFVDDKIE